MLLCRTEAEGGGRRHDQGPYFLKYKDPSTDRVYISGVAVEVGEKDDADLAMAWKFQWSMEQYSMLKVEA